MISKNNTIKLIKKLKNIQPKSEWKKKNQEILYSQIKSSEIHLKVSLLSQLYDAIQRIMPKKIIYSIMTLLFILISGSIISVKASENTMPGDFFYNVKLIKERIYLKLAPKNKRIELRMKFAQKRLSEVNKIIANKKNNKKQEKIDLAIDDLNRELDNVKDKLAKINNNIVEQAPKIVKEKHLTKIIKNQDIQKTNIKKEDNKKTNNQNNNQNQQIKQNKIKLPEKLTDNIKEVQKLVKRKDFKTAMTALIKVNEKIKGLDLENLIQKTTEEQAKTDKNASTTASTTITSIATTTKKEINDIDTSSENNASSVTPDLLDKTNIDTNATKTKSSIEN